MCLVRTEFDVCRCRAFSELWHRDHCARSAAYYRLNLRRLCIQVNSSYDTQGGSKTLNSKNQ